MPNSDKAAKDAAETAVNDAPKSATQDAAETAMKDRFVALRASHMVNRQYAELARLSTGLFVGLLALMTFVLNAGLQHPQKYFSISLYIAIVTLPLSLLTYMIGQLITETSTQSDNAGSSRALMVVHRLQQLFVIAGIVAVTALALSTAAIFFAIPATAQPAAQ